MDGSRTMQLQADTAPPPRPGYYPQQPLLTTTGQINTGLKEFLAILNRRRTLIGLTVVLITVVALVMVLRITPRYTSEAALLIDTRRTNVIDEQPVIGNMQADAAAIRSEIDVIRSRQLVAKVIDKLGLGANPIFTRGMAFPGQGQTTNFWSNNAAKLPESVQPWVESVLGSLHLLPKRTEISVADAEQQTQVMLVDKFLDNLGVNTDPRSNTIKVTFTAEDPSLASQIANALVDLYLVNQLDEKYEATKRASVWLNQRIDELKAKVATSDQAINAYRAANGLQSTNPQGVTINSQQLGELNAALVKARAEQATAEAKLRAFQSAARSGGEAAMAAIPEVVTSPLLNTLKASEAEIIRRKGDLDQRYGPDHPAIKGVNAELRDVRNKIAAEMKNTTSALATAAEVARSNVASLEASLKSLGTTQAKNNDAAVRLNEMNREQQADRTMLEQYLARQKEVASQHDLQQADARVIARGDTPIAPSFPNKPVFIMLAVIAATMIGVCLAILVERLDNGLRGADDVERYTGLPALGFVPAVTGIGTGKIEDYIVRKPHSAFGETIQSVRAKLKYTNVDQPPRVILITSSVPAEGKSLIALSLARNSAKAGNKTLLIDCDLRKPTVHRSLNGRTDATLTELFAGSKSAEEVLQMDEQSGLHYIAARAHSAPNPPDLFGSMHMRDFLRSIATHYDLIVLDSPPVMAATDSTVLSRIVDSTLFVVRWGHTPRPMVLNALKQLRNANTLIHGVILSRVHVKKHARYGFGDVGSYYGKYKPYGA